MPIRTLYKKVPTGPVISFMGGMAAGAFFGVGSVYCSSVAMSGERIGVFLAAPSIGCVVSIIPAGWLSDRFSRPPVIVALSAIAALVSVALTAVDPNSFLALGLMFVLGATMFPVYSIGIANVNDYLNRPEMLGAAGTLVRINGAGAVVGPVVAGAMMAMFSATMFFWVIGAAHVIMGVWVLYRLAVYHRVPANPRDFVVIPVRATATAASMIPRRTRSMARGATRPNRRRATPDPTDVKGTPSIPPGGRRQRRRSRRATSDRGSALPTED